MSQYHKHDLARWEGEGGSHGELMPPAHDGLHSNEDFDSRNRSDPRHDCSPAAVSACGDTDPKRGVLFGGNH